MAAIIDVVANTEARRQIIGLGVGPSEAETFRMDFMSGLNAWGLDVMKLVISDAHTPFWLERKWVQTDSCCPVLT